MRKLLSLLIITCLFIPQFVFAQSNYDTSYNITVPTFGFMDNIFGSTSKTYKDVFDEFKELETSNYFMIMVNLNTSYYDTRVNSLTIQVKDSYPLYDNVSYFWYFGSNSEYRYLKDNGGNSFKYKEFNYSILDQTVIDEIKGCITNYNSCGWSSITALNSTFRPDDYINIDNNQSASINVIPSSTSKNLLYFPIYANFSLTIGTPTQNELNENSFYFKKLVINDIEVGEGNSMPTYYDLFYPNIEPEPDEPVDPDEPSSIFTSWIYWFSEPTDSISVLNNIYTLLFLYCFTIIILKLFTIFKVKNRR